MIRCMRSWLVVAALVGLAGCGDDFTNPGGVTLLQGQVVETGSGFPVFDLGIGLTFATEAVSASGGLSGAQLGAVTLESPYPCPVTTQETVRVELLTDQPATEVRVVVVAASRSLPGELVVLHDGELGASRTVHEWNLRDQFGQLDVPNGIYTVRAVIARADGPDDVLERDFLVNRPPSQAIILDAFNAFTDPDGDYRVLDVPTGSLFTATDESGAVLGTRRVRERTTLFHSDIDYVLENHTPTVPPGTQVEFSFAVQPRVPVAPEYPTIE